MTEHERSREPDLDELRAGISAGKVGMQVQAVVSLPLGHAAGLEGFLRWYGEGADVSPSPAVMRLAERYGLVPSLIRAQFERACALVEALDRHPLAAGPAFVSLNVSTRHLSDPVVCAEILDALATSGVETSRLIVELNDAPSLDRGPAGMACLNDLRRAGVRLALDHFGADAWSVRDLRELPLAELKVDESSVHRVSTSPKDLAVVTALIDMAHGLDLLCSADGVQDEAQATSLSEAGCDLAQGPHWGSAAPEAAGAELLDSLAPVRP